MELGDFLPERSIEDILGERVRLTIGGHEYVLPVLNIADNELWLESVEAEIAGTLSAVEAGGEDLSLIMDALTGDSDSLIVLLRSYDQTGQLPDDETLKRGLTPMGLIRTCLLVWRAANPKADIAIAVLMDSARTAIASQAPTNGRRRRGVSTTAPSVAG